MYTGLRGNKINCNEPMTAYKGDIVSVQIVEDEGTFTQNYVVFVDEIYHGMEEEEEGAIIVLTTGIDKCGKPGLSKGSHLFQGRGSSRELTSCDIVQPFQSLDESDIENLRSGTYSKNCAYFYDVVCLPTTVRPDVTMEETTQSPPDGMTTADT
ncbi:uncharacterized protein [Apostichopus japonicus]|uniref:uncharacterized protein isoform X2 n=1 Tax=Stichopus japonicus TaxID=307972 RepID=UPI003AB491DA